MQEFADQSVVITGGNSGIGFAAATLFRAHGASVAITGRSKEKLEAARVELGADTRATAVEASSVEQTTAFMADTAAAFGKIDVLVVSAGGATVRPFTEIDEAIFDEDLGRNFKGAFFATQQALRFMPDGARIVLLGSAAGSRGFPGMSVYGPAKAALRGLTRVLAAELAPRNIRVNLVSPGPVPTPGFERLGLPPDALQKAKDDFLAAVPLGRMGTVDEIAQTIAFLASTRSSFIHGVELAADGGMAQV